MSCKVVVSGRGLIGGPLVHIHVRLRFSPSTFPRDLSVLPVLFFVSVCVCGRTLPCIGAKYALAGSSDALAAPLRPAMTIISAAQPTANQLTNQ